MSLSQTPNPFTLTLSPAWSILVNPQTEVLIQLQTQNLHVTQYAHWCVTISPISSLAQMSCTTFHHSNLSVGSFHAHFLHHTHLCPSIALFPTSSLVQMSPLLLHCFLPLCPFVSLLSSFALF